MKNYDRNYQSSTFRGVEISERRRHSKEKIMEVLNIAKENGMKAYINTREDTSYGWIVTHNNNILYIAYEYLNGYDVSLQYRPNRDSGSGCGCNPDMHYLDKMPAIDYTDILRMEQSGLCFASKLGAPLYNDKEKEEYFTKNWDKNNIHQI
jgi:hypothetical protein